jgi:hypothetical protein
MTRSYFTVALAAILAGCTCSATQRVSQTSSAPQETLQTETGVGAEKTTAVKTPKAVAINKTNLRHRVTVATHTKITKPSITAKIENPQQSKGTSTGGPGQSIGTKVETPATSQSDGKSGDSSGGSSAKTTEVPQTSQSGDKSADETDMKSVTPNAEATQSFQLDDESVLKKAKTTIAAMMDNPRAAVFLDVKRADRKDALGISVDTVCGRVIGELAGAAGERPFLYIVQKDEAYIGGKTATAAYRYRNICN